MAHSSYYLIGVVLSVIALPVKAQDAAMVSAASDKGSIVARINASASGISVEAPQTLIDRAERVEPSAEPVIEDAEVHEQESMVVRTKGGKTVGYRVQVYADNNARSAKTEARQRERAVGQAFPDLGTYVSYVSPYWRLRISSRNTMLKKPRRICAGLFPVMQGKSGLFGTESTSDKKLHS